MTSSLTYKKCTPPEWSKSLTKFCRKCVSETVVLSLTKKFHQLENLSSNASRVNAPGDDSIRLLLGYFQHLVYIERRFFDPGLTEHPQIQFVWHDSFNSKKKSVSNEIQLEKAGTLFNLGVVLSHLAQLSYTGQDVKTASKLYQAAAGVFLEIRDCLLPHLNAKTTLTNDLKRDILSALVSLLLGCAQACYCDKLVYEQNGSNATAAKLAFQAVSFFDQSLRSFESSEAVEKNNPLCIAARQQMLRFAAEGNYRQALSLNKEEQCGEVLARLELADNYLTDLRNFKKDLPASSLGATTKDAVRALQTVVNAELASAKKLNDHVYHHSRVKYEDLLAVNGKAMVKAMPLPQLASCLSGVLPDGDPDPWADLPLPNLYSLVPPVQPTLILPEAGGPTDRFGAMNALAMSMSPSPSPSGGPNPASQPPTPPSPNPSPRSFHQPSMPPPPPLLHPGRPGPSLDTSSASGSGDLQQQYPTVAMTQVGFAVAHQQPRQPSPSPAAGGGGGGGGQGATTMSYTWADQALASIAPAHPPNSSLSSTSDTWASASIADDPTPSPSALPLSSMQLDVGGWELSPDDIKLGHVLGRGAFGKVFLGEWHGNLVAVKELLLSGDVLGPVMTEFRQEVRMLSSLRHPNVISFFGCCQKDGQILIVTEYAEEGNLRSYILNRKPNLQQKIIILHNIVSGMKYLVGKNILHRDLVSCT